MSKATDIAPRPGQLRRRLRELERECERIRAELVIPDHGRGTAGTGPAGSGTLDRLPASCGFYREMAQILDISADAIISVDDRGLIRRFNRGAEAVFGYRSSEVIGRPLDILIPERFRRSHRKHLAGFARATETSRLKSERGQLFGLRKDGTEFPADISIARLETNGHRVFTAIVRDVSHLSGARGAVHESGGMDRFPAMVAYVGADRRVRAINGIAGEWLARPAESLAGQPLSEILPAGAREAADACIEATLGGACGNFAMELDRPDGGTRRLSVACLPHTAADGAIEGVFLLAAERAEPPDRRS